ncbi:hypothetical protein ACFUEM_36115 [Streptomyces anulatus]|uniref:hypothetical protein n=1 Tax=Streptomyces anulatus TaxID=1892 RepID=UPI0035E1FE66
MTEADSTYVNAAELLALSLHHLDDANTRRPIIEIPTLDDSPLPFRPFPALAIAMAGHVLSAWEVRMFRVERALEPQQPCGVPGQRPQQVGDPGSRPHTVPRTTPPR